MRKVFLFFSFVFLLYAAFGFYLATFNLTIFADVAKKKTHPFYHDYNGVTHVVTNFSKGSALPASILVQATDADLDFLFFTDLNLTDRPYNISGYQGDVFTFSNQKVSYLDAHILVYSENVDFYFDSMSTANAQLHQHFFESNPDNKNFLAVLAHPFKINHGWSGEYPHGLDGIEVINMRHLWQELWMKKRMTFIWSLLTYPFNAQISFLRLIDTPRRELELWDFLNTKTKTLGFLGNETTAKIFRIFGENFTFPSYEKSFRFASNHILTASELTGQVASDRKKIFAALKNGNFYMAFDSLGSPSGFASYVEVNKQRYLMGSEVKIANGNGMSLKIDLPEGLTVPKVVEVYKNGELVFRGEEEKSSVPILEPGNYRVVVNIQPKLPLSDKRRWFGWIYTNNFYIKK